MCVIYGHSLKLIIYTCQFTCIQFVFSFVEDDVFCSLKKIQPFSFKEMGMSKMCDMKKDKAERDKNKLCPVSVFQ